MTSFEGYGDREKTVIPISPKSGQFKTRYDQEMAFTGRGPARRGITVFLLLVFGLFPLISCNPFLHFLNTFGIYAIVALGLNILCGYTRQISLGHGALFGIGACAASYLGTQTGISLFLFIPAAGLLSAAAGTAFALPAVRFKAIYMCAATLAGQFIIEYVLKSTGLDNSKALPGFQPKSMIILFYITFACFAAMLWLSANLHRTKTGRAFTAIGQNERWAALMGITVFPHKLTAFAISGFYAGTAGALFAAMNPLMTPADFDITVSIKFLAICFIGGMGTLYGAILGAFFMACLEKMILILTLVFSNTGVGPITSLANTPIYDIGLGLTIVLFVIFKPDGLAGIWQNTRAAYRLWPFSLKQG